MSRIGRALPAASLLVLVVLTSCSSTSTAGPFTVSRTTTQSAAIGTGPTQAAPSPASSAAPSSALTSARSSAPSGIPAVTPTRTATRPAPAPLMTTGKTTADMTPKTNPAPAPPVTCSSRILAGLTERQRIGQLLMIGIPADDLESSVTILGSLPVGGVFLAGKFTAGAGSLAAEIAAVQQAARGAAGVALHVAVDQEGGYVQSLRGPDFPPIPAAVDQGQESAEALARNTTRWSTLLVRAGVTLDLAPVADTVPAGTAADNPPIGQQDRQYGSTSDAVSRSVVAVIRAMLGAGLGTTVKHFPGLGRVTANTDTSTDAIDDRTSVTDENLRPFRDAIAAHTTAVMISSANYPQLDASSIAAFSKPIITGLLRNALHFSGLVISDDFGGAVAVSSVPVGQRAVEFITAGGDMVLTVQPSDLAPMTAALTAAASQSAAFGRRADDAALHVLQSKQKLGMLACE